MVFQLLKQQGQHCKFRVQRVIPRELLRQKAGVEFVYNVDLGGFYE